MFLGYLLLALTIGTAFWFFVWAGQVGRNRFFVVPDRTANRPFWMGRLRATGRNPICQRNVSAALRRRTIAQHTDWHDLVCRVVACGGWPGLFIEKAVF